MKFSADDAEKEVEAPELPDLKKKEEKKRRGGAWFWRAGSGSGDLAAGVGEEAAGEFLGAEGLAGAEGAAGAGEAAGAGGIFGPGGFLGRFFGPGGLLDPARIAAYIAEVLGPASRLGAIFASQLGAPLVLGAMVAWGALMAGAGWAALRHFASSGGAMARSPMLDGVGPDGLRVRGPADGYLSGLAGANRGELYNYGEDRAALSRDAAETAKEEAGKTQDRKDVDAKPQGDSPAADPGAAWGALGRGLDAARGSFIRKLTTDPAQLGANTAAGSAMNRAAAGAVPTALKPGAAGGSPKLKLAPGALSRLRSNALLASTKMSSRGAHSITGMGQLKFARDMSLAGTKASSVEGQSAFATGAFEQSARQGGQLAAPGGMGGGIGSETVVPPGVGAPSGSGVVSNPTPNPPQVAPPENVTPYQNQLNSAQNLGNMAAGLKMMGMMMMVIALAMIAIGIFLATKPSPINAIGIALIAMGTMMLMMAMGMMQAAGQMAGQGQQIGQGIQNQYGQTDQGEINNQCMSQAAGNGTSVANCRPTNNTPQTKLQNQPINDHLNQEQNSTYRLDDGNSPPAGQPVNLPGNASKP